MFNDNVNADYVRNITFNRQTVNGYDRREVNEFLDDVYRKMVKYEAELKDLELQNKNLKEKNKSYEDMENTLSKTVIVAQDTADRIVKQAQDVAHNTIEHAELKSSDLLASAEAKEKDILNKAGIEASDLIANARYEEQAIIKNIQDLKNDRDRLRLTMIALAQNQIKLLTSPTLFSDSNDTSAINIVDKSLIKTKDD